MIVAITCKYSHPDQKGDKVVELHGWITIRETYRAFEKEEENIEVSVARIRDAVNRLSWFKPEIKAQNGVYFLEFTLFSNRINPEVSEVFELCKWIGEMADGSYGLIYLYNDEDIGGKENQFQVFSLARGVLKENKDSFLSPIIPTIEDEDRSC